MLVCGLEVKGLTRNQCLSGSAVWSPADCQVILGIIYFNAFLLSKKCVPIVERKHYDTTFECFTDPPYELFFRNI